MSNAVKLLLIVSFFINTSFARERRFSTDFSGNIDAQSKELVKPESAKDLGQDWSSPAPFNMVYGNIDARMNLNAITLDVNWFFRYTRSDVYENYDSEDTTLYYAGYPRRVIARDIFKLEHTKEGDESTTESILNKFVYEWDFDDTQFSFGRMFIQYGEGHIYNPLNPFNTPTTLTPNYNIQQGNDGFRFQFGDNRKMQLQFFILGDKAINDYSNQINRTVWLHGDIEMENDVRVNYVIGEDQKRHNLGVEVSWLTRNGLLYGQVLNQSKRIDRKDSSERLSHSVLGYQQNVTEDWNIRLETGRQDFDEEIDPEDAAPRQMGALPQERYVGLVNGYALNETLYGDLTWTTDPETNYQFALMQLKFRYQKAMQFRVFASRVLNKDENNDDWPEQRLMHDETGVALNFMF